MVGGGDGNHIEVFVLQSFSDILGRLWWFRIILGPLRDSAGPGPGIGIDKPGNFDIFHLEVFLKMGCSSAIKAGNGNSNGIVGAQHLPGGFCAPNGDGCQRGNGRFVELAAIGMDTAHGWTPLLFTNGSGNGT